MTLIAPHTKIWFAKILWMQSSVFVGASVEFYILHVNKKCKNLDVCAQILSFEYLRLICMCKIIIKYKVIFSHTSSKQVFWMHNKKMHDAIKIIIHIDQIMQLRLLFNQP